MKHKFHIKIKQSVIVFFLLVLISVNVSAKNKKSSRIVHDTLYCNIQGSGADFIIEFVSGEEHNHPTFAIWLEDMNENYIQTLFATRYIATGIFQFGPVNDSVWGTEPGEAYRPAALPYWNHKRIEQPEIKKIMPEPQHPLPDAYSGATPTGDFILTTKSDNPLPGKFRILFEINQTWDWNEYWTNNRYPGNKDYASSSQPSVIYSVTIDTKSNIKEYTLNAIGHGHYAGNDGRLYTDLSTLTTALQIVKSIKVVIK